MDPALTWIGSDAVPRANFRARRRHYGDTRWLVLRNEWYELDEATDIVWLGCERSLTVAELIHDVAARTAMPLNEAMAAVAYALLRFHTLGLIEGYDGATGSEEPAAP